MCFEMEFENRDRVNITNVWWEGVSSMGVEWLKDLQKMVVKQTSAIKQKERTGRCVNLQELREVLRGKIMDVFEGVEQNLETVMIFDLKPVKLLEVC